MATAKKNITKTTAGKKTPAKKTPEIKKTSSKKTTSKQTSSKKTTGAKKSAPAKKTIATKKPVKTTAESSVSKRAVSKKITTKTVRSKAIPDKTATKKTTSKTAPKKTSKDSTSKTAGSKSTVTRSTTDSTVKSSVRTGVHATATAKKTAARTLSDNKAMGRGLSALFASDDLIENKGDSVVDLKINDISPNNGQPRKIFNDEALKELASSIEENGVIQPIIVQRKDDGYRIVAGERRWRAARIAGLTVIPAIIRDLSDRETMEQALIENIQREDLNPIEEASAMQNLLKTHKLTQEQLAKKLGKPRATIANTIRILNLDESLQEFVSRGDLSEGHAKVILGLKEKEDQRKVADVIMTRDMNVRQAEVFIKKYIEAQNNPSKKNLQTDSDIRSVLSSKEVETRLKKQLGAKVKIKVLDNSTGRGRIVIDYKDNEDLDRLLELLCE